MSTSVLVIRGEHYVRVDVLARCYGVEVRWLLEVHALGLIGRGAHVDDTLAIATAMLDRLGTILQLHRQQGVNLEGIARILGEAAEPWSE